MKQFAGLLLGLGLTGAVSTAHALCVHADGSLDDPSVPPSMMGAKMLPPCAQAAPTATVAEAQSLRVVRDKTTGKLRAPNAEEMKAMDAAERAARKARGLPVVAEPQPAVVTRHANGMLSATLGPDYLETLKGERQADGSVRRFHPDGTRHDGHPVAHDNRPTE